MSRQLKQKIPTYASVAIALLSGCCVLAPCSWAQAESPAIAGQPRPAPLASYNWSVSASPNLVTKPPPEKVVDRFIRYLLPDYEDHEALPKLVCSFRFADLRNQGDLSLVVGIDVSGRGLCSQAFIVDKTGSGFEIYDAGGSVGAGADVSSSVDDIRHDGKFEYILDVYLGSLKGDCVISWPVIYAWKGGAYRNVSDEYRGYYQRTLDSLSRRISALPPKRSPYERTGKECLLAETARIHRFLGTSNAGLDQAARLATSKDPAERELAVELLRTFSPTAARKYLEILAKDSDRDVADSAKTSLSAVSKGPSRPEDKLMRFQQ